MIRIYKDEEFIQTSEDMGKVSDGYHTFDELYDFRKAYNAILFNEWAMQERYNVHKSKRHSDGELCFGGGWFVVSANTPFGQITNHYEMKDWDMFKCAERDKADEWDGHTPQTALERLTQMASEGYSNYSLGEIQHPAQTIEQQLRDEQALEVLEHSLRSGYYSKEVENKLEELLRHYVRKVLKEDGITDCLKATVKAVRNLDTKD